MEAAGLIHAESGDIADVVTKMALADGKNVIFDITMTTSGSVTGRIKKAKAHGYDEFTGVYVDVPLEVSLKSAQERYIRGAQEYTEVSATVGATSRKPQSCEHKYQDRTKHETARYSKN
ncbi:MULTISPECIES: zeta toxin family protein [Corynebacterium]|nr:MULTISPECIES: zeta toxin family protein [Corynebacterium]BDV24776.1 hypothetical protein CULTSU28_00240 [Corynebacterium ulcerans]STC80325.1 Zeta toxin [Corynebacterium ulcerans]